VKPAFRILYAEDNPLDVDLTRTYFFEYAAEFAIDVVQTGNECLDRLAQDDYDLLLLDHHLPDMEGVDVLSSLVHRRVQVPVVLVTGVGDENLVVKALRLGAASYVPKLGDYLVSLPDLLRLVIGEHRLKKSQGLLTGFAYRMLYVEHNAMDVELTLRHFAESAPQFKIEVVNTCGAAMARLAESPAYDVVLIDLRMPDQSGLDFAREAKHRGLPLPPFIMLSGMGDDAAAIASLRLGAADYVAKREGYLNQLQYTIERAIAYDRLDRISEQLRVELAERKRIEGDRERLEVQLREAQRMEAIGRLAGGIAHDFNNLLSVIIGGTGLAMDECQDDDRIKDELREVEKAAKSAAVLTRQLLAFSRKQVLQPIGLNLNRIVGSIEKMLRRIIGEDIDYVQMLAPDLGVVLADPGQIEQVLMNLVVNARDAMPTGGKLTIETSNVEFDVEYTARDVTVEPGSYVYLAVTDTGFGMDEKTKARIFEPFFTTKGMGKGTGLGLSTVYGIVKQSGGNIWVDSEPGIGSTFRIHLPRVEEAAATAPTVKTVVTHAVGTETILVVEDEEGILGIASRILGAARYTVLSAPTAEDALRICKTHPAEIQLLLTDVVMPQMSGRGLAERMAALRPGIKVLYMSGYTDDIIAHHGTLAPGTHFIAKPFGAADLTRKVREVLDIRSSNPSDHEPFG
jgi:two-component system, cell cycle sensor histidine kinase and response regulator CckA